MNNAKITLCRSRMDLTYKTGVWTESPPLQRIWWCCTWATGIRSYLKPFKHTYALALMPNGPLKESHVEGKISVNNNLYFWVFFTHTFSISSALIETIERFFIILRLHRMKKEDILQNPSSVLDEICLLHMCVTIDNNCAMWLWVFYILLSSFVLSDVGCVCVTKKIRCIDSRTNLITALNSYSHSSCYYVNLLLLHPIDRRMSKRALWLATALTACNVIGQPLQVKEQVNE